MNKTILGLFALCLSLTMHAQRDQKATNILDAVIAKTEAQKNIEVNFVYSMQNPEAGIDESKNGILKIMGNSYRLEIAGQIVISDGETLWTLLLEDEEVMINEVEEGDADAITPSNLLNSYNENYKSKYIKEDRYQGKTVDLIELTPLKGRNFTKIHVIIDQLEKQILSFSIFDKNGSTYSYSIKTYKLNQNLPDTLFTFREESYPNFEVVDMR